MSDEKRIMRAPGADRDFTEAEYQLAEDTFLYLLQEIPRLARDVEVLHADTGAKFTVVPLLIKVDEDGTLQPYTLAYDQSVIGPTVFIAILRRLVEQITVATIGTALGVYESRAEPIVPPPLPEEKL